MASSQPLLVGGWRSGPLASSLLFSECEGDDPTRPGAWKLQKEDSQQLTVGREKFVSVGVPLTMIPSANRSNKYNMVRIINFSYIYLNIHNI